MEVIFRVVRRCWSIGGCTPVMPCVRLMKARTPVLLRSIGRYICRQDVK